MKSLPLAYPGMRIGLFGGSFNPPHKGHLGASRTALKRLNLDRIWWLVSPQNPLKRTDATPPLQARLAAARALIADPRIVATDLEAKLGTRFTIDTIRALKARYPAVHFVFIMGADNWRELPRWKHWDQIMQLIPIAIVARPGYGLGALWAKPALRYGNRRVPAEHARRLVTTVPPAWTFLYGPLDPTSSTALRKSTI
jgi:nicotinate-nucleotide adenylyltransferase